VSSKVLTGHQKQAAAAIFEYIEVFYNKIRAHSTIGYYAPTEFEETKNAFSSQRYSNRSSLSI